MPTNFDVYPSSPGIPPTDPLLVPSHITVASTFVQRTGPPVGNVVKMMFIRVGMVQAPAPEVSIQAGAGPLVPVPVVHLGAAAIYRGLDISADYVGDIQLISKDELPGVLQYRVGFFANTTETWQLHFKNTGPDPREFTWVVAGTVADTAQPWITLSPATVSISSLVNRPGEKTLTISQSVQVANKGTAPLVLDHLDPAPLAALEVTTPLPLTVAVGQQADLVLRYTPPDAGPAQTSLSSTVVANPPDQTAGTVAGHNQRLQVTAAAQELEVVLLLDDSGSMGTDALGGTPSGSNSSRWKELIDAAQPFLDLLAAFGAGRGKFGIARFPASNPNNPSTFDLVRMTAITTNMAAAQTAVAGVTPFNSTPMGDGLFRVLGPTIYFSGQTGNRRWLILMSDGAHNSGTHNPNEFLPPPGSPPGAPGPLADRGISLFGVAYGIDGHTDVNHTLIKELAAGSAAGGDYHAVKTEHLTPQDLSQALRATIKSGLTAATSALDPSAVFVIGSGEARHDVVITRYDTRAAFVLSWNTPNAGRLRLELLAPGGGRITPENAGTGDFAGVTFKGGDRSQLYLVEPEFLGRKRGPAGQQSDGFGTWTFVVSHPSPIIGLVAEAAAAVVETELYLYDTIVESGLQIEVQQDPATSYAGDPITLSARITADGRPVRGATVTLSTTKPAQSFANWLAALQVPADALEQAEKQLAGKDHTPILVKQLAAQIAKLTFDGGTTSTGVPMTDPDGVGVYRAVFTNTSVPEHHTFYVTATGVTDDGVSFRREGTRETFVLVRPDPLFSHLEILEIKPGQSRVTVSPRDRFGNVLLVDPITAPGFGVTATGATTTPLTSGLNGSYTSTVSYDPATRPTIGATYGGVPVVTSVPTVPLANLHYPDRVLAATLGAIASANKHADPTAALGSVVGKPADRFVSLGANGSVELGFAGQVVPSTEANDLTVFIAPDRDLRSYRVAARAPGSHTWVELGNSPGITQSFALAPAGLTSAAGIRITDTSGRTRDDTLQPLSTPGVSVQGLGALSTVPAPKTALSPWPLTRRGQTGHPVRTLQWLLRARGHTVVVDGIFGPKTDAAVRAFQQEKHLQVDGIAGPITWPALSVTVKRGSEGDAVRGVQEELEFRNQSGGPGLAIDGKFGPKTEAAVRGFQQAIAVDVADFPVDGIVGPKTWQAMVSGMLSAPKTALSPWPLTRRGQTGHPVRTLQWLLRARGHTVVVDGIFGPKTDAAVRAFQQEKHLQVDGIAGPITWPALSVTVKRGSEGDAVRGVQEELEFRNQSGGPGLAIDGKFGPKTEAAVRGFQQAIAVDVADFPVDGIVGPKTWQAMVSGMLSF